MKAALLSFPLRTRLVLAGTLVQAVLLALLIANGISVMERKLDESTRAHLEEQRLLLNAALSAQLVRGDHERAQSVLDNVR
ncbi:MAG: hypothetical protein KIT18_17485, partial [Burkholderiales bacterium]|nr:hypothetical protein [Burkholderiales bacterium]